MGCFIFTGSLQEIMFQVKLIGYSENKGETEVRMRERGSKKGGACRFVCGELYVLNGHVRQKKSTHVCDPSLAIFLLLLLMRIISFEKNI